VSSSSESNITFLLLSISSLLARGVIEEKVEERLSLTADTAMLMSPRAVVSPRAEAGATILAVLGTSSSSSSSPCVSDGGVRVFVHLHMFV